MAGKHEPSAKRPERRTRKRKNKATGIIVAVIVIVVAVVVGGVENVKKSNFLYKNNR